MLGAEKTIAIHITKETDTAHGRRQMISKSVFLYSEFFVEVLKDMHAAVLTSTSISQPYFEN